MWARGSPCWVPQGISPRRPCGSCWPAMGGAQAVGPWGMPCGLRNWERLPGASDSVPTSLVPAWWELLVRPGRTSRMQGSGPPPQVRCPCVSAEPEASLGLREQSYAWKGPLGQTPHQPTVFLGPAWEPGPMEPSPGLLFSSSPSSLPWPT